MKRSPLRRRTPLRARKQITRKAPVRRGRKATRHANRERAPAAWFDWGHAQPCFVKAVLVNTISGRSEFPLIDLTPCVGGIELDHMGSKMREGDGEMAPDYTCVSICHGHHGERHDFTGTFKSFCQDEMRAFLAAGIAWMHARARAQGVEIPDV